MFDLQGKIAVVTGAGSGIGAAIARLFAARGALVAVVDRDDIAAARSPTRSPRRAAPHRLTTATSRSRPTSTPCPRTQRHPSAPRHPRQQRRHRARRHHRDRPRPTISIASIASTSSASTCAPAPRCRSCCRQGGGVILNMASIAALDRHPRSLRVLDDQGGGADDDPVDRGRLREARHPLQLHLPGRDPHAVRRRLSSRANYPGREAGDDEDALRRTSRSAAWGGPTKSRTLALYLCSDEASFVTGAGLSDRRRGDRRMKLARYGQAGTEQPGVLLDDGTRIDASGFVPRLRRGVLRRRRPPRRWRAWLADARRARRRASPPARRIGAPLARPSKIVCIGLNFSDHAAESKMDLPKEPVMFFKATTAIVGPDDPVIDPARRHQGSTGKWSSRW